MSEKVSESERVSGRESEREKKKKISPFFPRELFSYLVFREVRRGLPRLHQLDEERFGRIACVETEVRRQGGLCEGCVGLRGREREGGRERGRERGREERDGEREERGRGIEGFVEFIDRQIGVN